MKWRDIIHKSNEQAKTAMDMKIDEHADPKVQLEQAINAANERNDLLQDQAAQVIADQKMAESRWHKHMDELDAARADAATALQLAARYPEGSPEQARYTQAAQVAAGKVVSMTTVVERDHQTYLHTSDMAAEAHEAVTSNAEQLAQALQKRSELLADLHDTEMEESMHATMKALHATSSSTIPTLDQVEAKIEARKAKQAGVSELAADSPDAALAEVHHASQNAKANEVLDEIRGQLGMASPAITPPAPQAIATATDKPGV